MITWLPYNNLTDIETEINSGKRVARKYETLSMGSPFQILANLLLRRMEFAERDPGDASEFVELHSE